MSSSIDQQVSLTNEIATILREEVGLLEQFALPIAQAVVAGLVKRCGGDRLYVPSGRVCRQSLIDRDNRIRREFNGTNGRQIGEKYGISKSRLYEIIGAQKK